MRERFWEEMSVNFTSASSPTMNGKMPHIANRMRTDIPRITHDGEEWFINGREQLVEHKQPPFEFALSMISE